MGSVKGWLHHWKWDLCSQFNAASVNLGEDTPFIKFDYKDQAARSIVVSNLPAYCHYNELTIYFQKHKNGGGDIENIEMVEKGTAVVTFDEPESE